MVVLRYGGIYADVDTECGRPLDDFIRPTDSFIAGWEDEYATAELAVSFRFARQRQMEQWVFAAEPNHPALQVLHLKEQPVRSAWTFHPQTLTRSGNSSGIVPAWITLSRVLQISPCCRVKLPCSMQSVKKQTHLWT